MTVRDKQGGGDRLNLAKRSITELIGSLTVGQLRALLGSLFVLVVGAFTLGSWLGGASSGNGIDKENTIHVNYIEDRSEAYRAAKEVVQQIGRTKGITKNVLNIRASASVPEETELYEAIYREIKKGEILYTRAITYDSDMDLTVTRRFLKELGEQRNVRMVMIGGSPVIQGGIITNAEAILGFRTADRVDRALHVKGPPLLVRDIRTMYEKLVEPGTNIYEFKYFDMSIPAAEIDSVIDRIKEHRRGLKDHGGG